MKETFLRHRVGLTALCLAALPASAIASDYSQSVLADGPAAYYRLGDSTVRGTNNLNSGLATGVVASQNLGRVHTMPGAIAGDAGRAAFLLLGAMLATSMSANVFFWIIPGQRTT